MNTNNRDELADVFTGYPAGVGRNSQPIMRGRAQEIADAILADGYSKPRIITTITELERMPMHSVIRTHRGGVFTKHYDMFIEADNWEARRASIHPGDLPATVLYEPQP